MKDRLAGLIQESCSETYSPRVQNLGPKERSILRGDWSCQWGSSTRTGARQARAVTHMLAFLVAGLLVGEAAAMLTGGEGNKPIPDPGWPRGAAVIFNHPGRIAWWEGPPFGGGQWHSECRGDAGALSGILTGFSNLDSKTKRVVVHDGVGRSFWISEPARRDARADRLGFLGVAARSLDAPQSDAGRNQSDRRTRSKHRPTRPY